MNRYRGLIRISPHLCGAILVFSLSSLCGCGHDGPFDIVPVQGVVTYEDGSAIPASGYRVRFKPLVDSPDGKNFPRAAIAKVESDGTFKAATTHRFGDGIIAGAHKVFFERLEPGPNGKPLVPSEYMDSEKTPLQIDTNNGRTLTIKVPKPKGSR